MTQPITRPDEYAEIAANEKSFRLYIVRNMAEAAQWRRDHESYHVDLEKRFTTVTSSVTETDGYKNQILGVRNFLVGLAAIGTVIGGFIYFVGWLITNWGGHK